MLACKRKVEVRPLEWLTCGGKVIEDITYVDDEIKRHMQVLYCLHCGDETFVPLRKWNNFKKRLDEDIYRVRFGKVKTWKVIRPT